MQLLRTITPLGKGVMCGVLILAVGGNLGNWLEFQAMALALAATLLLSLVMAIGKHPFDVGLQFHKDRIVAGERAMILVTITNTGRAKSRSVGGEVPVNGQLHRFKIPRLGPGEVHEELISLQTTKRAVLATGPVMTVRSDPIGLFARRIAWGKVQHLIVHPRSRILTATQLGAAHDLEGSQSDDLIDADLNFHTLREYELGDDRRAIHWKSSAKVGTLLVRQYTMSQRASLVVHLDCIWEHYADDDEREEAISVAASLAVSTLVSGGEVQLGWRAEILRAKNATQVLDYLAHLEFHITEDSATDVRQAPRLRRVHFAASGTAVLISGSAAQFQDLAALARSLPAQLPAIGLRVRQGGESRASSVRRLRIVDGANLQSLPKVMGELLK